MFNSTAGGGRKKRKGSWSHSRALIPLGPIYFLSSPKKPQREEKINNQTSKETFLYLLIFKKKSTQQLLPKDAQKRTILSPVFY